MICEGKIEALGGQDGGVRKRAPPMLDNNFLANTWTEVNPTLRASSRSLGTAKRRVV
jgi:hypothetical protein